VKKLRQRYTKVVSKNATFFCSVGDAVGQWFWYLKQEMLVINLIWQCGWGKNKQTCLTTKIPSLAMGNAAAATILVKRLIKEARLKIKFRTWEWPFRQRNCCWIQGKRKILTLKLKLRNFLTVYVVKWHIWFLIRSTWKLQFTYQTTQTQIKLLWSSILYLYLGILNDNYNQFKVNNLQQ